MTSNINRRAIVKGAAWVAPAITATAMIPAYAASTCVSTKAWSWAGFIRNESSNAQNRSGFKETADLKVTVTHNANGTHLLVGTDTTPAGNYPGGGYVVTPFAGYEDFLNFQTSTNNKRVGRASTITLTFSKPIYNLRMPLLDIDKGSVWEDHLAISMDSSFTLTALGRNTKVNGNELVGTADSNDRDRSTQANALLEAEGPITSITMNWSNGRSSGEQRIGIGTFTYCTQ